MTKQMKPKLTLLATVEDQANSEFFALIKYRDIYGGVRRVQVSLAELNDLKAMKKLLTNAGAYFSDDDEENLEALWAVKTSADKAARWVLAPALGWYDDYQHFVRPKGVIGSQPEGVKICPPRKLGGVVSSMRARGNHENWVEHVAAPAKYSSRMVLAICAAFAAPLLKVVDMGSFAIYLTGASKMGKTTVTLAVGSVIGLGTEDDLPNFRTTDAAFGELPRDFNDSVMPLNEFGLLKGTANERRQRQRELTYGFAEGRGTTYSRLVPVENSGKNAKWSSIIIANGEETSDELAMHAGEIRMAGETVRWIDLPGAKVGCPDVFDRAPSFNSPAKRSAWFAKQCAAIRAGCRRYHGMAHWHFIKRVIGQRQTIRGELVALRDSFVKLVTKDETDHVVQHLARNFGHIYAAGIQAVRFGTVPWSEDLVLECVRRCYRDARREIKSEADLLRGALRRLRVRAADRTIVLTADQTMPRRLGRADGYRGKGHRSNRITVRADAFKAWFDDPRQPKLVLEWLRSQHCLPSRPKPSKRGQGIVWAESQPQWPDGTRRRSVVIDVKADLFKGLENVLPTRPTR
jgi:putative DNA primase/helicase